MFGQILLYILFALAFASTALFLVATRKENEKLLSVARYLYYSLTGGIIAISVFLMYNILIHNFQFTYIWSYSSSNLPLHLLVSSFYAGQEGSFLLWTLLLAILGVFVLPYAKKRGYESWVMGIYSLIIVFLLLIMIVKSPFTMIWESFPGQNLGYGFTPPQGRGLNPILQNYWIAIHPPILFIGYAAMTVPFIFAVTGMIKKDYTNWINIAMPWTLFAAGILGLGIMMGGFWAYETLGWGGFWGWDPVENASLHPWIIAVALVHTILVQKRTGGLVKTNFALAIIGFVLVLFATYLTRSGVLGDASVHSFVDPGQIVNLLLVSLLGFFTLGGFIILLIRFKDMPKAEEKAFKFSSKEMWLSIGSILLIGLTILIIYGTIRPILPEFLAGTKAALKPENFNAFAAPITILILVLNAVSIYLSWKTSSWSNVFKKISLALILSTATTVISYFYGITDFEYLLLGWTAWFSLFVNIELIIKNITKNPKYIGAYLSHLGISALILGTIASGAYSISKPLALEYNKTINAVGYDFTLVGKKLIERELKDREKYEYQIKISKDNETFTYVTPIVYWSDFNSFESPFFEPGIKRYIMNDLYVSPKTWEFEKMTPSPILKKGESAVLSFDSNIVVTLVSFDMSGSHSTDRNGNFMFGVVVDYKIYSKHKQDTLKMEMSMNGTRMSPIPKIIPGTDLQIMISEFKPNDDMAQTQIELMIAKEVFYVDATVKPFINLVWFGVIALVIGFFISMGRHLQNSLNGKKADEEMNIEEDTELIAELPSEPVNESEEQEKNEDK